MSTTPASPLDLYCPGSWKLTGLPLISLQQTSLCMPTHIFVAQIEFPVGDLGGFSCAETEVRFSYKYKNLRTALSNIPQKDTTGVNSKVRV